MVFLPTNEFEISSIIRNLKNSASAGLDDVTPSVVKFAVNFISLPLSHLINCSMTNGVFPSKLKLAKVIPIHKNGDLAVFSNYRPISILNCFSKIYEKIIAARLEGFLLRNNILYENQFGFRKGHTTYMALTTLVDKITSALDKNNYSLGIFIDLSKAFDTIDHSLLLRKLQHYGVRGIVLKLFADYLSGRYQIGRASC